MALSNPFDLLDAIEPLSVRIHAPTKVLFLCGGEEDGESEIPLSLRDAFYRIAKDRALDYEIVLAEGAKPLEADAGYQDLFQFESDIAQVVALILLFAESPGSLAELGAFSAIETIAPSLLAVSDDFYYDRVSFIRNGPIRFLENKYGEEWINILERADVGIGQEGEIDALNHERLFSAVEGSIDERLKSLKKWKKFDASCPGHLIIMMVGFCQEFGALTKSEIKKCLEKFSDKELRMKNFLYCAELLGWLKRIRKGHHIYYASTVPESALDFHVAEGIDLKEKVRWRSDIREYWKANESSRMRAISDAVAGDD